jgi:hypothetical protein
VARRRVAVKFVDVRVPTKMERLQEPETSVEGDMLRRSIDLGAQTFSLGDSEVSRFRNSVMSCLKHKPSFFKIRNHVLALPTAMLPLLLSTLAAAKACRNLRRSSVNPSTAT